MNLDAIQRSLVRSGLDGWLLYDFHHRDLMAYKVLGLETSAMTTRRWFYFIPAKGEPVKLSHKVEPHKLDPLPGRQEYFLAWRELHAKLAAILGKRGKIAMQYSPMNAIPYVSVVDAGTIELVRSFGHEIANLPYKLVGAQRFYGRREVKDLIAYLRLIHNPNDELSLTRIINTPTRGIGDKTFLTLRTQAQKANLSPGEMVLNFSHGKSPALQEQLSGRSGAALANFGSMQSNWIALKNDVPPLNLMDRILTDTDYRAYIDDGTDTGQDRWDNIMEMRRLAAEFEEAGLEHF